MIHAWRGLGKTQLVLDICYAVASAGAIFGWQCPCAQKVLLIDGEMSGGALQERLRAIILSGGKEFPPENLTIITPDLQYAGIPNLATKEGRQAIAQYVADRDLIVLDNLSALCRSALSEKEDQSWGPIAEWALQMRQAGKSVIFVHHSGKSGAQRGTSKREDILDVVIGLKRPSVYNVSDGARFEVHFEKSRGITGDSVNPFEATLSDIDGRRTWATRSLETSTIDRVAEALELGMSLKDIAGDIGASLAHVYRANAQLKAEGFPYAQEKRKRRNGSDSSAFNGAQDKTKSVVEKGGIIDDATLF